MQITLVSDSVSRNPYVSVLSASLTLIWQPSWMDAFFQYGRHEQFLKF